MQLENYLQGLSEQVVQEESKILLAENPVVNELRSCFKEFFKYAVKANNGCGNLFPFDYYLKAKKLVEKVKYDSKDVSDFLVALTKDKKIIYKRKTERSNNAVGSRVGLFLSALINQGSEEKYQVITKYLPLPINYLGFKNEKKIVVVGDLGSFVGWQMQSGEIKVKGDIGLGPGAFSKGGRIYFNRCDNFDGYKPPLLPSKNCKVQLYRRGRKIWPK